MGYSFLVYFESVDVLCKIYDLGLFGMLVYWLMSTHPEFGPFILK